MDTIDFVAAQQEKVKQERIERTAEAYGALPDELFMRVAQADYRDIVTNMEMLQVDMQEKIDAVSKRQVEFEEKTEFARKEIASLQNLVGTEDNDVSTRIIQVSMDYLTIMNETKETVEKEVEGFIQLGSALQGIVDEATVLYESLRLVNQHKPTDFLDELLLDTHIILRDTKQTIKSIGILITVNQKMLTSIGAIAS